MSNAIEVMQLTKTYSGGVRAMKDIDLTVGKGSCFGLLGPNGAGKSTLVKTLLSIVRPTSGSATILDIDIRSPKARAACGYLPEGHRFSGTTSPVAAYAPTSAVSPDSAAKS